jgi:serine/threonine protein kinase
VRVLDYGVVDQQPYLVTDWCAEGSLANHLAKNGPMALHTVVRWLTAIASAIAEAHRLELAHCDIKPSNIMLTRGVMGQLEPRVIDFGIAQVFQRGAGPRAAGFSPAFAAPEQVLGESIGPATDVHALALLFTTCLLGRSPYGEEAGIGALAPIRPTPKAFGIDCGPFEGPLAKALALRPADRYADAGLFVQALQAATSSFGAQATALAPIAFQPIVQGPPAAVLTRPAVQSPGTTQRRGRYIALGGLMLTTTVGLAWALVVNLVAAPVKRFQHPSWASKLADSTRPKPTVSLASITGEDLERRGQQAGFVVVPMDASNTAKLERLLSRSNVYWSVFVMDSGDLSKLEPLTQKQLVISTVGKVLLGYKEDSHFRYGISGSRALVLLVSRFQVESSAEVDDVFQRFAGDIVFEVVGSSTGADPAGQAAARRVPAWSAKRLSELTLDELDSRVRASDVTVERRSLVGALWIESKGAKGTIEFINARAPGIAIGGLPTLADRIASLRTDGKPYAYAQEGDVAVLVYGDQPLTPAEVLASVLEGLGATVQKGP